MASLAHARLLRQGLIDSQFNSPAKAVSWLGVVQAQDFPAALWAVGLRVPELG